LRAADLDKEIGLRAVGDSVRLAFFRHDVLRETVITIGGQPDVSPSIRKLDEVSDEQKAQFDSWLGKAGD
jgi:predicted metalloprotease with PDZ domain